MGEMIRTVSRLRRREPSSLPSKSSELIEELNTRETNSLTSSPPKKRKVETNESIFGSRFDPSKVPMYGIPSVIHLLLLSSCNLFRHSALWHRILRLCNKFRSL